MAEPSTPITRMLGLDWESELREEAQKLAAKSGNLTVEQAVAKLMERPEWRRAYAKERRPAPEPPTHPSVTKLRELRKERGLTQVQVAKSTGVTQQQISEFESSPRPSWDSLSRYAQALGLSHRDLLDEGVL